MKLALPKIAAALSATLLTLVGAEIVVRLLDLGPEIGAVRRGNFRLSSDPELRYELLPGSEDGEVTINADGMRDRDYPVEHAEGVFRIAVIGDSVTYGLYYEQHETFAAHLERLLNRYYGGPDRRFEVMNFGVTGYNFPQNLRNLEVRALKYSPDLVLLGYCLNDPQDYSLEMEKLLAELSSAGRSYWDSAVVQARSSAFRSRLFLIGRYAVQRMREGEETGRRSLPEDPRLVASRRGLWADFYLELYDRESTWRSIDEWLAALRALTVNRGTPLHTFIFPVVKRIEGYVLRDLHTEIRAAFAAHGLETSDLLDAFATYQRMEEKRIGKDSLHLRAEGHEFTAVCYLHEILRRELVPGLGPGDFRRILEGEAPESRHARIVLEPVE